MVVFKVKLLNDFPKNALFGRIGENLQCLYISQYLCTIEMSSFIEMFFNKCYK